MSDVFNARHPRWGCIARTAALALAALAAPVAAQTVTDVSISPAAPTWRERVDVTLRGTVPSGCIPILGPPDTVGIGLGTFRIDLPVAVACPPLPLPLPGSRDLDAAIAIGPFEPGSYTLRVLDVAGTTLAQLPFTVYEPGDAAVELPAVSTANHPGAVGLTWLAGVGTPVASVEVVGRVVEIHVSSPPASFSPTQLASLSVPLPILDTGRYELRVLFPGLSPQTPPRLVRSALHVLRPAGCVPDEQTLCLHDGRFRLTATWRDFARRTGVAHAAPLAVNDGSGLLWFFGPDNAELTVKVLDACTISQRWWTFVSSSSTVEYTLTVTDTATGRVRTYTNPLGQVPRLIADTDAFACP